MREERLQYPGRRRGSTSEFAVVLMVFFFLGLFPLIDLVAVAAGAATVALASREAASKAGSASAYDRALQAVVDQSLSVANSGFGKFAKLKPVGGVANSEAHLFIVRTDYNTSKVEYCGPEGIAPTPVDTTGFIYEYMAMVRYEVGPMLNLGSVPFVAMVPGLGQPATLTFTGHSAVELPESIATTNVPGWLDASAGTWTSSLSLPSPW